MVCQAPQPFLERQQGFKRDLSVPLGWGFALLLILMITLVGHAIWHISVLESRMRDIVEAMNLKIQLATDLQEAAYNRHVALSYQTIAQDPFERDESFQHFIKWGYHVGKARTDLKALPLDQFEKANLKSQDDMIVSISSLHDEIADLAARGHSEAAQSIMATKLRPLNLAFTDIVEQLRRHERDQIQQGMLATQQATSDVVRVHFILGGVSLILALLIALAARRQLARHTKTICRQMTDLEEAGRRLEHEATHDHLTGLANRALFQRRMAEALAYAQEENCLMGVIYLDLDDFKLVNDQYGHTVGDIVLREIGQRLRHLVRMSDTVSRLGGDEFAIVLTGLANPDQCTVMKKQIQVEITRPIDTEGIHILPGGSAGCVIYPRDGKTLDELLNCADERMYAAKRSRKADQQAADQTTP